jgi:trigger factor
MAAAVETISSLERRMTIKVPLAPLEGQIKQRLTQISRTAKVFALVKRLLVW